MLNLPSSWSITLLREVVTCISQNEKKLKQKEYQEHGKYPVIDQGQVFIGGYSDDKNLLLDFVPPVIVFGDHTKVKKFVNFNFIVGADGIKILKPLKCFDPKLFFYFLHCIKFVDKGYARHYQHLIKEHIPLPPLPEQHRIVAKLEELFSQLDIAVEALRKAKEQVKTYKQAVLAAAFSGKLTSSMQNVECKMQNEETGLPEGWKWVKLEEYSLSMKNGIYKPAEFYNDNGIACLRMYNIQDGKIEWYNIKRMILTEEEKNEYCLLEGDILVNRVNSRELVGKSAIIYHLQEHCIYESKNIRLRLKPNLFPKYLNYWLLYHANQYFNRNAQQTVGMASINQVQLSNLPLPFCDMQFQKQIVAEIESRFSEAENLEKAIDLSLEQAESLRQSILKKAFEGRLVPQDPNDEPAAVLLERIKKCRM